MFEGTPRIIDSCRSGSNETPGRFRRVRSIASAVTRSSRTSSGSTGAWSPRASSTSSATSAVISVSCSVTSRSSCSRSPAGSASSRASTSMFVRRLVSGVRSSCEASETSCRCERAESSSAPEHRVEGRGEPRELVLAVDVDPLGEVARLRDVLGGPRQPLHRREHGPRDEQPEGGGEPDPDEREGDQPALDSAEGAVDLLQRARHLHRVATTEWERQHADVCALDVRVLVERVDRSRRVRRRAPASRRAACRTHPAA